MKFDTFEFELIGQIEPRRADDGSVHRFMPQQRFANRKGLALNKYGEGPFCKFSIVYRKACSGVYAILIDGEPRYIGECANLVSRFNTGYGNISLRNCFKGGQETNCRVNNLIYRAASENREIALWFFETANYKVMEGAMRSALKLAWNRI